MNNSQISRQQFNTLMKGFEGSFESCKALMASINERYVNGTEAQWNTPAASNYIDALCNDFNSFIEQFNSKYHEGMQAFVKVMNALEENESIGSFTSLDLVSVDKLNRSWSPKTDEFNIPADYADFTEKNLSVLVREFNENISKMSDCINRAVKDALGDVFGKNYRESLIKLGNDVMSVTEKYSSEAAKIAVGQDSSILNIKSNS